MGIRGPAPTPTGILQLHGSKHAKYTRRNEPKGTAGRPTKPKWLNGEAGTAWRKLIPLIEDMEVLKKQDGNALARYCQLWKEWRDCVTFLEKYGVSYPIKDAKGNVVGFGTFPQAGREIKLAQLLTRMEQEFGMTPSARARLAVSNEANKPQGVATRKRTG